MSYIVNLLKKEYLDKIHTTKDLIYKTKEIDVHDIAKSYEKKAESGDFFKMGYLTYNGMPMYVNKTFYSKEMATLVGLYKLTTTIMNMNNISNNWAITEVQNSLWIEGVKSSKKKIKQVIKDGNQKDPDFSTKIIINYNSSLEFIMTTNNINEKNLYTLYSLMSKDIDMGDEELDGFPYRKEDVEIGTPEVKGVSPESIKTHMDNLFEFVNSAIEVDSGNHTKEVVAFIAHYMFEIIHPYYDMNGRMGRLFSLWIARRVGLLDKLLFWSESINNHKHVLYYKSFQESSINDFKNDPTYFIGSMLTTIVANNLEFAISNMIESSIEKTYNIGITKFEKDIIKSLLSKDIDKTYVTASFILGVNEINPSQVSRALKKLVALDILIEVNTKPKKYSINWTEKIKEKIVELMIDKDMRVEF